MIHIAHDIQSDSWLTAPEHKWFVDGYNYAATQTRAIPVLSDVTPEALYFAVISIMRGAGINIPNS